MSTQKITFTVEEMNLITTYKADTVTATIANIAAMLDDIMDEDIITIAETSCYKLAALSDMEFSALSFIPADEYEGEEHE